MRLPKFHPQYFLKLSVLYIPVLNSFWVAIKCNLAVRFSMSDSFWNKFITQTQKNRACVYFFSASISIFFNKLTPSNLRFLCFFPRTAARLWNSLLIGCLSLTCDLNGFTSRINRHLLNVGFF